MELSGENKRAAQQIIGREGETATFLKRRSLNLNLRVIGFAPRHLNRSAFLADNVSKEDYHLMKNSVFAHSTNILLVILLIWIISVGCKNSNSNNANTTTNEISGEVFPANEVCNYPDIPIIKKYGGFNLTWGKGDTETDFRYLCNPFPTKLLTLFHDEDPNSYKPTTTEIQISYSARGNRIEGAHTIYMNTELLPINLKM